jgi:putative phosphoribosyl transferase
VSTPQPSNRPARSELFLDRRDAGRRLAESLRDIDAERVTVLGIPRGGVEVAAEVADELDGALDVVVPRKLGAPGNPELGIGAVAEGVVVLDERLISMLGVGSDYLDREIGVQREEIARRERLYRGDRPPAELTGALAIVVDDGVATGGTASAALRWARSRGADEVMLAVPVAPPDAVQRLAREADSVRVLLVPERFSAVGQWYLSYDQVPDERVIELLHGR